MKAFFNESTVLFQRKSTSSNKIGGPLMYVKNKETICLTNNQARHIYKKVELEAMVNEDKIN